MGRKGLSCSIPANRRPYYPGYNYYTHYIHFTR
jgi:hypothetical protein